MKMDLCDLKQLDFITVMDNLKSRFEEGFIYTKAKDVLISINPYDWRTNERSKSHSENKQPHIFDLSTKAYSNMQANRKNQSIIVNGESGAGKTEAVKLLTAHLVNLARSESNAGILDKIVHSNLILEIFGNAKTSRNYNSSRYGKFLKLCFDKDSGHLIGSYFQTYLLEKNRVISLHTNEELPFHIFYLLFTADEILSNQLHLQDKLPNDFTYLTTLPAREQPVATSSRLQDTLDIFPHLPTTSLSEVSIMLQEVLQLSSENTLVYELYAILSGILHLGQLSFTTFDSNEYDWMTCAELLGITVSDLHTNLTKRNITIANTTYEKELSSMQAKHLTNSLASELYQRLFQWIIQRINHVLAPQQHQQEQEEEDCYDIIAMLDIFGFEIFTMNHLEQLLINYANEKLHALFVNYTILLQQEEYQTEGLLLMDSDNHTYSALPCFHFPQNDQVLTLLESRHIGMFDILQDIVTVANNNNHTNQHTNSNGYDQQQQSQDCTQIVRKFEHHFHPTYATVYSSHRSYRRFSIQHFAQPVEYTVEEFIPRNRDMSLWFLDGLCSTSSNQVVQTLSQCTSSSSCCTTAVVPTASCCDSSSFIRSSSKTVAKLFQQQLQNVIEDIENTEIHFLKCLKSNDLKIPCTWDDKIVQEQLQYSGIIEACQISRGSYPMKLLRSEFVCTYLPLYHYYCTATATATIASEYDEEHEKQAIANLLTHLHDANDSDNSENTAIPAYQIGKTKVFLCQTLVHRLADYHTHLLHQILTIQSYWRAYLVRKYIYYPRCKALYCLQHHIRHYLAYRTRQRMKQHLYTMATIIQCRYRGHGQRWYYHQVVLPVVQGSHRLYLVCLRHAFMHWQEIYVKIDKQWERLQVMIMQIQAYHTMKQCFTQWKEIVVEEEVNIIMQLPLPAQDYDEEEECIVLVDSNNTTNGKTLLLGDDTEEGSERDDDTYSSTTSVIIETSSSSNTWYYYYYYRYCNCDCCRWLLEYDDVVELLLYSCFLLILLGWQYWFFQTAFYQDTVKQRTHLDFPWEEELKYDPLQYYIFI